MAITSDRYFLDLAEMFIAGNGVFPDCDANEMWFDVTDINGHDLRHVISRLNDQLIAEGLILRASIYGSGEGHLWFTDEALRRIEKLRKQ